MDRKKLELIVTAILVVVFIFILSNSFKKTGPKKPSPSPQVSVKTVSAQQSGFIFGAKREKEANDITIDVKERPWGRDPFVLQEVLLESVDTIGGLKLMGITGGQKMDSMAIINNEIVSVGATIGKFKVLRILRDRVIVSDGEKEYELKMISQ